jgi:DNA-binding transcriptional LysR family regulator
VVLEVEGIEAARRMVERKLGLAFLPQIAVMQDLQQGILVAVGITNAEPLRRNIDVIHPRHRPLTKDAQTFLLVLKAAAAIDTSSAKRRRKSPGTRRRK